MPPASIFKRKAIVQKVGGAKKKAKVVRKTKGKKKTAKQNKSSFKDVVFSLQMPVKIDWYYKITEDYLVFAPFGKDSPCEVIGIDIGTKHLGIAGLSFSEGRKFPVWTWCCLISVPEPTLHASVDRVVDIILDSPHLEWFRNTFVHRIEQQMQINPKARAMACVLRTLCRVFSLQAKRPKNVEFVHGELKYAIAPLYSEAARQDPLRKIYLGGASNTRKRKILGKNDTENLLRENGEKNMLRFIRVFGPHVDSVFDLCDAYLVGRSFYEPGLKSVRPKKNSIVKIGKVGKEEESDDEFGYSSAESSGEEL